MSLRQDLLSPGDTWARFGWLHLSDLHLGPHGSRLLQPEYQEALEQDLRRLHAQSGPWHVVFISGDLTLTGSDKELQLVDSTLRSLWDYLRSLGSDPYLLAVPGQHDLWEGSFKRGSLRAGQRLDVPKIFRENLPDQSQKVPSIRDGFEPFIHWFQGWRDNYHSLLSHAACPGQCGRSWPFGAALGAQHPGPARRLSTVSHGP